jgi:hypothetical protein
MQSRRNRDAGDGEVRRGSAVDAAQIAQMRGAGGDEQLTVGLGSRATTTGQAILLRVQRARRSATGAFVLCSNFLEISTSRQEIFLIFMIARVLKSRIIVS